MIYFILTIFFVSLLSIVFMIWRKLVLLKNGQIQITEGASFEIPYIKEATSFTIENAKKYEHLGLVMIVKFYFQFSNFLKNKYKELKTKIQNIHIKNHSTGELIERAQASKLLKVISTYKHKITEITHKIKEEEKEEKNL